MYSIVKAINFLPSTIAFPNKSRRRMVDISVLDYILKLRRKFYKYLFYCIKMKNIFNKLILSIGIETCLIGCPRNEIYEVEGIQEAELVHTTKECFFRGRKFDFYADKKYARRFGENKSAIVKYKVIYEFVKDGYVNESGIKEDLWIEKEHQFVNAWPKEEKE